jgi:hypothetical protein
VGVRPHGGVDSGDLLGGHPHEAVGADDVTGVGHHGGGISGEGLGGHPTASSVRTTSWAFITKVAGSRTKVWELITKVAGSATTV